MAGAGPIDCPIARQRGSLAASAWFFGSRGGSWFWLRSRNVGDGAKSAAPSPPRHCLRVFLERHVVGGGGGRFCELVELVLAGLDPGARVELGSPRDVPLVQTAIFRGLAQQPAQGHIRFQSGRHRERLLSSPQSRRPPDAAR